MAVAPGFICRRAAGHVLVLVLVLICAPWRRAFIAASVRGPCCRGWTMSAHALVCVRAPVGRDVRDGPARSSPRRVPWPNRWRDGTWRAARTSMIFFTSTGVLLCTLAGCESFDNEATPAAGLKFNRNCSFIYGHMARESRLGC